MDSDSVIEDSHLNEVEELESTEGKQSNAPKPVSSITLKQQPEMLCNCPLHCDTKISKERRELIYKQFQDLGDHALQNQYIQRHIKIKSIAKRLWEDEIIDKKIQRRVTCKYLIPMTGNVIQSYSYARTLTYDSVKYSLDTFVYPENGCKMTLLKDSKETHKTNNCITENSTEVQTNNNSTMCETSFNDKNISMNGDLHDNVNDTRSDISNKENPSFDVNSPLSFNDNDSVNTLSDDINHSDLDISMSFNIKYIEVCQKAFMNMYGITEKRIRWQREKLILKSRFLAEKKRKEVEEMDRTLSLAHNLGAGCQPLFALLEKSNCTHLSEQLMGAIEDDVALVNNFFHNQLWKPEDIMNKSIHLPNVDSFETECDSNN